MFYKKGVLKNFTKLKRKHLCQSLYFNKVAGKKAVLKARHLSHSFQQFVTLGTLTKQYAIFFQGNISDKCLVKKNLDVKNSLMCGGSKYLCPLQFSSNYSNCIIFPTANYMFKVNNRNTRTRCELCSKLTINTPEWRQQRRSDVFIVNFEHFSHLILVFLLLTLSI